MVKTKKEDLQKDLNSKKETIEIRIKSIEKQETQLKEKASSLQIVVMENMIKSEKI